MWNTIYKEYDVDTLHRMQAVFTSVFVLQNRVQTACEKIETKISMKQWLVLAMVECCPKPRTLSNVGKLMGCSRQNIKRLALTLEKEGFVRLISGSNNSIQIELTEKVSKYDKEMRQRHLETLKLLFIEFSEEEIEQLFSLYYKLYLGVERVEKYAKDLSSL